VATVHYRLHQYFAAPAGVIVPSSIGRLTEAAQRRRPRLGLAAEALARVRT
jgi:hypothetical protein